ncbi:MAG TPA: ATP phosphoribosyltransferase [Candidatus Marinimicrobia bacterium]|nr:ATP phosphoribosyltransferase [Candidatus Neomarinimicrobiota bacterium]
MEEKMITLAIQKKGRLAEDTRSLLKECGIKIQNGGGEKLISEAKNFPLKLLCLRDDDIPATVAAGVADIGIVGENTLLEKGMPYKLVEKLNFAHCCLSLALPKSVDFNGLETFHGMRIATSYPKILQKFLQEKGISASIHEISGSVEAAPGIGLADAIFDIVSTGSTLTGNGLKEVYRVLKSQAVLVRYADLPVEKLTLIQQLQFRIQAVRQGQQNKYILLNTPNEKISEITGLLPGMKSPTIMPLAMEGWSSLHSVIPEEAFWEKIEALKATGAQGILVIPIEKMIV